MKEWVGIKNEIIHALTEMLVDKHWQSAVIWILGKHFHFFFTASNGGSDVVLSTNDHPKNKAKICEVEAGFSTGKYEYDRYSPTSA